MKGQSGEEGFAWRYAALYQGRWPAIERALKSETSPISWEEGLVRPYSLDPASVLAALALPACQEGECIDLCAAPGGKSLVLAARLGREARLVANERSQERSGRLRRVLDEHLPPELRSRIFLTTQDGAVLCRKRPSSYERILLDAPCSSERHVLSSPVHLARWSPSRVRRLAQEQWALLSSAFLMLKPDGFLVYSTCSIGPEENDGVVSRLFAKYGEAAELGDPLASMEEALSDLAGSPTEPVLRKLISSAEPSERGVIFMPDRTDGSGPMFVSLVKKKGEPLRLSRSDSPF
jgi:16S rRNA C967 or C1407 C5-methylase (RsmB/RsmF family)